MEDDIPKCPQCKNGGDFEEKPAEVSRFRWVCACGYRTGDRVIVGEADGRNLMSEKDDNR